MQNLDVLGDVTTRLERVGLRYMLTGSTALNYYAVPRMTRDIDIVLELSASDVPKLVRLFSKDYYLDDQAIRDAICRRRSFNLIHYTALVKVDFIVQPDAEYQRTELGRRRQVTFEGVPIWIIAPEDLVLSKLDWARQSRSERQLTDVRNVLSACDALDWTYLRIWAARLGLEELLDEVSS